MYKVVKAKKKDVPIMKHLTYRHPDGGMKTQAEMLAEPYRASGVMHPRGHGRFVLAHASLAKLEGCLIDTWFNRDINAVESQMADAERRRQEDAKRYANLGRRAVVKMKIVVAADVQHSSPGW